MPKRSISYDPQGLTALFATRLSPHDSSHETINLQRPAQPCLYLPQDQRHPRALRNDDHVVNSRQGRCQANVAFPGAEDAAVR